MKEFFIRIYLWLYNVLVAFDQLGHALFAGAPDQTWSAYLYHAEQRERWSGRIGRPIVDLLFRAWEKGHCQKAWEFEPKERKNAVKHMFERWKNGEEVVWRQSK